MAIVMGNRAAWHVAAVAVFRCGGVLVPLDAKLPPEEIDALLRHAGPVALVTDAALGRRLLAVDGGVARGLPLLVAEAEQLGGAGGPAREVLDLEAVMDGRVADGVLAEGGEAAPAAGAEVRGPAGFRPVVRELGDDACIVYSSGSGGTPKGCVLSHGNYLRQAEVLSRLFPFGEGDRFFSFLPTNHAIDFMCGGLIPMLSGGTVVHQRTLRPELLGWTMRRYRPTHMAAVPRLLEAFEEKVRAELDALPEWKRAAIEALMEVNHRATVDAPLPRLSAQLLAPLHRAFGGRLRLVVAGGAPVSESSARFFHRIGIPVAIGYGLTEAGTVLTVNDLEPFRGDTVGRAVPGTALRILDPGPDGVGEVLASGPTVMQRYLDAPELTAETIREGWLHTGDLGVLEADGHLRLVGRRRNMIVTPGGKNVYPEDVERAFVGVRGVEELVVMSAGWLWPGTPPEEDGLVLVVRPVGEFSGASGGSGAEVAGECPGLSAGVLEGLREANRTLRGDRRCSGVLVWGRPFPLTASMKVKREVLAEAIRAATGRGDAWWRLR
ncbi:MAG: hypothetical protein EA398_10210 [Deltaproteobacteria bacterium]|nr:MAG: hypothetical protein EA398_10210 [Deltaproteobacteria bacterium]